MVDVLDRPDVVLLDFEAHEAQSSINQNNLDENLRHALNIVRAVTRSIGHEIEAQVVSEASEITQEPRVYILNPETEKSGELLHARFMFKPEYLSGAADSAHSVMTGQISLNFRHRTEPKEVAVAVKCFIKREASDRIARALREITVMERMQALGEPTLKPLALVTATNDGRTNGEVILVTEYDPSILTLDNHPWGRGFTHENLENAQQAVRAVSHFNQLGIMHGDAKVKNIAIDANGRTGMIDYETCKDIDLTDSLEVGSAAFVDFSLFLKSLYDKGFLIKGDKKSEAVSNELAQIYLDEWDKYDSHIQEALGDGIVSALIANGAISN